MKFHEHSFSEIKGNVSNIVGYADILKNRFSRDILDCIGGDIDIYTTGGDPVDRYILVFDKQQIADCKVVIDHFRKEFFVSSIAVVPNLQQKGIATTLYNQIILPKMYEKYPNYTFIPAPQQRDGGKKLWKKILPNLL